MNTESRWQDRLTVGLGVFLFISPMIFGFFDPSGGISVWHSLLMGGLVVCFGALALYDRHMWEEGVNLILGIWLIVSPFLLGFSEQTAALLTHMVVGLIVGIDAAWSMMGKTPEHKEKAV